MKDILTTKEIYLIVMCFGVLFAFGGWMARDVIKNSKEEKTIEHSVPWVVYKEEYQQKVDTDALTIILQQRCKTGVSHSNNEFTVYLGNDSEPIPRWKLLVIVQEVLNSLPKGHPYTIKVETVEDAVKHRKELIEGYNNEIWHIKHIHEGSSSNG